ncbi:MAG: D-glycero-beta-D-manno-heptose-7-phosphate kinase [Proteobacteria bacterium]|nr:D-glycero-beta-D-manno-heptose-7-phosphate kinase [Pseudomonadota bacterium]
MKSLHKLLEKFKEANVLVIGDLILDHYIWGKVDRISPEAPVPVVRVTKESFMAGGCANVALNIRALKGKVSICGVVGKDQYGRKLLSLLEKNGIDSTGVFIDSRIGTIRKTRVIAHHQHVVRVDREEIFTIEENILRELDNFFKERKSVYNVIIFSDYAKGFINNKLVDSVKKNFKESFFLADPKVKNISLFKNFYLITPNRKEAMEAVGMEDRGREEDIISAGKKLLKDHSLKNLLITRGEEGMSLFSGNNHIKIPTFAQEVFDVTGAGDTVIATIGAGLSSGIPLIKSCIIANLAASVVVGKVGTAVAIPEEIEDRWKKLDPNVKDTLERYL